MERKIAFDLDGTISNSLSSYLVQIEKLFGKKHTKKDITSFYFEDCIGLTDKEVSTLFNTPESFMNAKPYILSPPVVNYFSENLNWEVHIVTDRPKYIHEKTADWLNKWNVDYHHLAFVSGDKKAEYAKKNNIDVFVEDKPSTIRSLLEVCKVVFALERDYNLHEVYTSKYSPFAWRIANFSAIIPILVTTLNIDDAECLNDL